MRPTLTRNAWFASHVIWSKLFGDCAKCKKLNCCNEILKFSNRGILGSEEQIRCFSTCVLRQAFFNSNEDLKAWRSGEFSGPKGFKLLCFLASCSLATGLGYKLVRDNINHASATAAVEHDELFKKYGVRNESLPVYSLDDVRQHTSIEDGVWICFNNGVYDITEFINEHPGGDKIMLGAGSSVEPFWALYAVHKSPHVLNILERYRIGNLKTSEVDHQHGLSTNDPYADDPKRHPDLKLSSKTPFNAEPPLDVLVENVITPTEFFYVRNHLSVPNVNEEDYELEVSGLVKQHITLKLDDLKAFPKHSITATLQCGGNRRSELQKVMPIKGLSWGPAAISNATWSGARLCDVLRAAGVSEESGAKHVQFEGIDVDPTNSPYGASIPIFKALDPNCEVLLAYEMNGKTLTRDHGYPVRVVVPGVVGARSVKWLASIIVSEEESQSHWQQKDYKSFAPSVNYDSVQWANSPAIQELPVVSAICSPKDGANVKLNDNKIIIKGYAFSGGGRKIIRVDVSVDDGKTWQAAENLESDAAQHPKAWGWTIWTAHVQVPPGSESISIVTKAVDSSYNTQPEKPEDIWNLRGVLCNSYHRIRVHVGS